MSDNLWRYRAIHRSLTRFSLGEITGNGARYLIQNHSFSGGSNFILLKQGFKASKQQIPLIIMIYFYSFMAKKRDRINHFVWRKSVFRIRNPRSL
jgi:hypothetical protein